MEINFTSCQVVSQSPFFECFKLTDGKEAAQFARANVWELMEFFLLAMLIRMK